MWGLQPPHWYRRPPTIPDSHTAFVLGSEVPRGRIPPALKVAKVTSPALSRVARSRMDPNGVGPSTRPGVAKRSGSVTRVSGLWRVDQSKAPQRGPDPMPGSGPLSAAGSGCGATGPARVVTDADGRLLGGGPARERLT